MAITITTDQMTSDLTHHAAALIGTDNGWERWTVTWLPGREIGRSQATTAMLLAERCCWTSPAVTWPLINSLASELELTGAEAYNLIRRGNDGHQST